MIRLCACLFLFFNAAALTAQTEADTLATEDELSDGFFRQSDIGIVIAAGLSTGGGFGDFVHAELKDQGYVTTGRMLFVDTELGMEFRAADKLFVLPRIGWLFTALNRRPPFVIPMDQYDLRIDPYEIGQDDVTVFSMLLCSAGARYYLYDRLPFLFYVEADIGYLAAVSRIPPLTFSSHTPSAEVFAGYAFSWGGKAIGLELGWRSVPVTHSRAAQLNSNGRTYSVLRRDARDFGGMFLNVAWRLDFFN